MPLSNTSSASSRDSIVTAAATAAVVVSFWLVKRHLERKQPFPDLPSPPHSHWITGQLSNLMRSDLDDSLRGVMVDHSNIHGQTGYYIFSQRVLSVWHAADVRAILNATAEREMAPAVKYHFNKFIGQGNLAVMNGKAWKIHRALIQKSFSKSAVESYRADMVEVTRRLVQAVKDRSATATTPAIEKVDVDLAELCMCLTVDVFLQTAFRLDGGNCRHMQLGPQAQAFAFLQQETRRRLFGALSPFNSLYWLPTRSNRQHAAAHGTIRSYLTRIVEERRASCSVQEILAKQNKDFLDLLLLDDTMGDERLLVDTLLSILFAGYDTTSIALVYALYYLKQHATIQERCLAEIRSAWKKCATSDTNDSVSSIPNLSDLTYTNAVLMEAIRLHPPATTTARTLEKDVSLSGGFVAPAGAYILIPLYHLHREEKNFEKATEFHPERWVMPNNGSDNWVDRPPGDTTFECPAVNRDNMLAFSTGGRYCPGKRFALQEGTLVLATLLQELDYQVASDYTLYPAETFLVQRPKFGMPAKLFVRERC